MKSSRREINDTVNMAALDYFYDVCLLLFWLKLIKSTEPNLLCL